MVYGGIKMWKYLSLIFVLFLISGCFGNTQSDIVDQPGSPEIVKEPPKTISVKEFDITAKRFDFTPSTITVNKGDKVKLRIKSIDVTHGFSLPGYGISRTLEPNKDVVVEFVADKAGSFEFRCNVFCGSSHSEMKGMLIVL